MNMQTDGTIKENKVSDVAREEAARIEKRWNGETDANAEFETEQERKRTESGLDLGSRQTSREEAKQFLRDLQAARNRHRPNKLM